MHSIAFCILILLRRQLEPSRVGPLLPAFCIRIRRQWQAFVIHDLSSTAAAQRMDKNNMLKRARPKLQPARSQQSLEEERDFYCALFIV